LSYLFELLNPKNFLRANPHIVRALGVDAAFALSALLERYAECKDKGRVDEEGFFFCGEAWLQKETTLTPGIKQGTALKALESNALIQIKKSETGKRYVKLSGDDEALAAVVLKGASMTPEEDE
jgi:hypothetical protein